MAMDESTKRDIWRMTDDGCDLDTREPDGTWIRATTGYGVDIHTPAGHRIHLGYEALMEFAYAYRRAAYEEDTVRANMMWVLWTDAVDALAYLNPDNADRIGWTDPRTVWRNFMARVDDVAADLAHIVGRAEHGALSAEEWLHARGTLLYLRAEALRVEPRTFASNCPDEEGNP